MSPKFEFAGRSALVVGAGSGIGRATAVTLALCGLDVALIDRSRAAVAAVADELDTRFAVADVSDPVATTTAIDAMLKTSGVSYIANCAGIYRAETFETLDDHVWNDVLGVNVLGAFHVAKSASRHLDPSFPAAMVNVSSIEANRVVALGHPQATFEYAASKSSIESLTRSLAFHLAPRGVRVNAVAPGPVDTPMAHRVHDAGHALPGSFASHLMIKRYATAEEVAEPIAFLLSDAASYITASVLPIDGGFAAL